MPPTLALALWLVLLLALLRFDPAKEPSTSPALWVPVMWMFIMGSRLPSQWLGAQSFEAEQALETGNPLDRVVYFALILLAMGILISRGFKWDVFLKRNGALVLFLLFALISVLWSDFTFVAAKRWFRDLGNYLMILVVLSDAHPTEAIRIFLRRIHYFLVPLSVLLVKYYAQIGKHYNPWTGAPEFVGAATSKNTLGVLCLMSGIFFFWDTVSRWSQRKDKQTKRILLVNLAFMAMTVWLLDMSKSATSSVCLVIGCLVIVATHSGWGQRHTGLIKVMMPTSFILYLILAFGLGLNGELASRIGRDPSLTGRTNIWQAVLSTNTNPVVGTGYESFWLGPRLLQVWKLAGPVTEAHDGYLDVYLNLGVIGLALLIILLVSSYRAICKKLTPYSSLASLFVALWTIALFYNMTEAAFKPSFMSLTFLLGSIAVAAPGSAPAREPLVERAPAKKQKDTFVRGALPLPRRKNSLG
jgi:O-antigen ligase